MKISNEQWWELSELMIKHCRVLDEALCSQGGWQKWSTSGMRMMTNDILEKVLEELNIEVEK